MHRFILAALVLVSTAFPFTDAREIVLPSGEPGFSIRCDEGLNACYELAGQICARGYTIVTTNTQQGYEAEGSSFVGPGMVPGTIVGGGGASARTTADNGLLVLCKDPDLAAVEWHRYLAARAKAKEDAREAEAERRRADDRRFLIYMGSMLAFVLITCGIVLIAK